MNKPLVSILCTNYNQGEYLSEAIESAINQSYSPIEILLTDNGSTDNSATVIEQLKLKFPEIIFLKNTSNLGICKAFNNMLNKAKGKYIIDLAADDVLLPDRVAKQVAIFEQLSDDYAVIFSDAYYINSRSEIIGDFYKKNNAGKIEKMPPSGDIYTALFGTPFICTPTMLYKTSVLKELGGFDEKLHYEDFDYWVRSARKYKYYFQNEITTLKRVVKGSITYRFYERKNNPMLESSLEVCRKAILLNKTDEENSALAKNIAFNLRQAYFTENYTLAADFYALLKELKKETLSSRIILLLVKLQLPVYSLYILYLKIRYGKSLVNQIR